MKHLGVITLFPDMFQALQYGITGKALNKPLLHLECWNPRDFTHDPRRTVDDRPYGGGPGMLMKVGPLRDAIQTAKKALGEKTRTIYLSPQGKPFKQTSAQEWAHDDTPLLFVAGRYEGVDERLLTTDIDEEWSIGDYVLSGGELAIMVMIDSMIRLLPGALGHHESAMQESFMTGLLDHPHYTRPEEIDGLKVPPVLLNGNHAEIEKWRKKEALGRTWLKRPDLLEKKMLANDEKSLLQAFIQEYNTRLIDSIDKVK